MALKKYWLKINGAKRMVVCDPADTLADVLRRVGLTGVKVGCNAGQCGACSVILNGEVVRACIKRMKNIKDDDVITTIEGIGTPNNLHPLQVAWNTYGAVQCGFCSPGFIVSAKGLLEQNPDPTREEVRAWFAKHHNICRCTGYKPIVDAVMAAAKVMRGEWTMDDITYKLPEDGHAYGTRFPRRESGIARVTGLANYGDDLRLQMPPETLELAPVYPDVAHAIIKGIDTSEAEKMPGVVKVVTAKDIKGTNRLAIPLGHPRALAGGDERPILADEKIFKYGDVVALVAADTRDHARAAAKKVKVIFEELPAYSQLEALMPDAIQIHEGIPNRMLTIPHRYGKDTREIMDKAPHVVEGSFYSQREPHLPIEPDVVQAYVDDEGVLTMQYKSQFVYFPIGVMAAGLGYPPEKMRIIENETGGTFGYSVSSNTMALAAAACLALDGQPVNMTMSYPEHQHITGKRAPSNTNLRLACDADGKMQALEYHLSYDHGGYTEFIQSLTCKVLFFMGFGYKIPNVRGIAQGCYSNYGHETTYRAFSSTQVFTSTESLVDEMAYEMGMDPFDFRYKNVVRPGDRNVNGSEYPEYYFEEMMDMLRPKYFEAKKNAEEKNKTAPANIKYGVGMSIGGYVIGDPIDNADADIELMPDGTFTHYSTWEDVGQHAEAGALLHAYEALRPMNVPLDKIKLVMNDTAQCPNTGIAGGSRLHVRCGNATIDACNKLMAAMKKEDGTYRTYDEMVAEGIPTRYNGHTSTSQGRNYELDANTGRGHMFDQIIYNLFMAEVHVDTDTGKTTVDKMTCVCDCGIVGNYLGVEGQAYGGIEHGIGFALQEDYSDMKKHATMVGAGSLTIDQMPDDIELMWHQTYREWGPHGSAGASENFQSSGHVAVLNAIRAATGVRIYELPAKPEKLKAAIDAKARGEEIKPDKYYLGGDLFDLLDECAANPVPDDVNRRYMRIDDAPLADLSALED